VEFLRSSFLQDLIKDELTALLQNSDYSRFAFETTIEIIRFPQYVIQLGRLHRLSPGHARDAEISAYAVDIIYYNLGPHAVPYELYTAPDSQINEIFDRTSNPLFVSSGNLGPGDSIYLASAKDVFKVLPTDRDTFQVSVVSTRQRSLEWHYDYNTLAPHYISAGRNSSSTMMHAITILIKMGCIKSAASIAAAFESEDHFVRWSAVRAVLALAPGLGRELLERAKNDHHPHVRPAAHQTAELLQSQPDQ